jgi:UPF0716 protein FxsA
LRYLFLFFILIPFLEIFILIAVSHEIGLFVTVNLVLFTAIVGTFFLRKQGLKTLFRARERIYAGEIPAKEMKEAIIISSSGVLLIIPGFITDFIGVVGLVPILRTYFLTSYTSELFVATNEKKFPQTHFDNFSENNPNKNEEFIDAEYWEEERDK